MIVKHMCFSMLVNTCIYLKYEKSIKTDYKMWNVLESKSFNLITTTHTVKSISSVLNQIRHMHSLSTFK